MKKIILLSAAVVMMFFLAACADNKNTDDNLAADAENISTEAWSENRTETEKETEASGESDKSEVTETEASSETAESNETGVTKAQNQETVNGGVKETSKPTQAVKPTMPVTQPEVIERQPQTLPEKYKNLSKEELNSINEKILKENFVNLNLDNEIFFNQIKETIVNDTNKWNNTIDELIRNQYEGRGLKFSDYIDSYTAKDKTKYEYTNGYPLSEMQAYIRYCIYNNQKFEPIFTPTAWKNKQYNEILLNFMNIGHIKIDTVDDILLILHNEETKLFDNREIFNFTVYFSYKNQTYIAYLFISYKDENNVTIKTLDIK